MIGDCGGSGDESEIHDGDDSIADVVVVLPAVEKPYFAHFESSGKFGAKRDSACEAGNGPKGQRGDIDENSGRHFAPFGARRPQTGLTRAWNE